MAYAGLLLFLLTLAGCWVLTLLTLPGNWLMVAAAAVYAWLSPAEGPGVSWHVVWILVGLAVLGELVELAAASLGARQVGASRRAAALALVGSMAGSFVGLFVGIPVPVVGPVAAAMLFAGLGALCGAMIGEVWKHGGWEQAWGAGQAAFWGRIAGTLAKSLIGAVMLGCGAVGAVLRL